MIENGSTTHSNWGTGNTSVASFLAVLLCLLLVSDRSFGHEGHPPIPTTGATVHGDVLLLSPGAKKAIGLETSKVTLANIPSEVRANGSIMLPWKQHAFVTTLVTGFVADVQVRPGEAVQQGQVLATISSLELEQIQLDMLQAAEDFSHFEHRFNQQQPLAGNNVVSGRKLLDTSMNREQAATRLHIAIAKLEAFGFTHAVLDRIRSTGEMVSHIDITSPIGGRVVDADVRVGQSVAADTNLFHVIDNSKVVCVADVLETGSVVVAVGQSVKVHVPALGAELFSAEISHIDIAVDDKKRALHVAIELDNQDKRLRPGMSARIVLQVGQSEQAIVCPRDSLIRFRDEHYVLLKRGEGKYVLRNVTLGRIGPAEVEILKGLFPGDYVTTTGTHLLSSLFPPPSDEQSDTSIGLLTVRHSLEGYPDDRTLCATGVVEIPKSNKFCITSRIGGRVSRIFVEQGQAVTKGQPLVEIESRELLELQFELLEKHTELRWSEATLKRVAPLATSGGVAKTNALQIRNDVRKLALAVAVLKRRLIASGLPDEQLSRLAGADVINGDLAKLISKTITLHAPHSGYLAHFDIVPGQVIGLQDELFEVNDLSHAWVKAYLFEDQASQVKTDQQVDVRFVADVSLRMKGRIVRMAPTATPTTGGQRVFPVWLELENSGQALREGMLAHVRIAP